MRPPASHARALPVSADLDIETLPGVYDPSVDSELLMTAFAQYAPAIGMAVLDLCCGSGVQAIAAARAGHMVHATDADPNAVAATRRNAVINGVSVEVHHGDLFEPVEGRRFDAVLANPPYVPTPADETWPLLQRHRWCDGGPDGRAVIDRICREAKQMLEPGGALWLVQSSLADIERTRRMLTACGLKVDTLAWSEQPFGPVSHERIDYLREQGYAPPGAISELLVVLRACR